MAKLPARRARISRSRRATCFSGGPDLETAARAREGPAVPFALIKTTGRAASLSARGGERARGSAAVGAKGCPAASRRDRGTAVQCSRPGGFFIPTWFSPLGLKEGLLKHRFSLKTVFPFPPFFFSLFVLFFPFGNLISGYGY